MATFTGLAHLEIHVASLPDSVEQFRRLFAFTVESIESVPGEFLQAILTHGRIRLVLTQGIADEHPATAYVLAHGDGVADIALRAEDAEAAYGDAVRRGARPVGELAVAGFGDVIHTIVDGPVPPSPAADGDDVRLDEVDHLAVCVPAGELDATVDYYRDVLGFRHTFSERIEVGAQAMNSKVVRSEDGGVTLTILEPDTTRAAGQIDMFVKNHGGAGVQHVAYSTDDAVRAVAALRERGVVFLSTPDAYYEALAERIVPDGHSIDQLRDQDLLLDTDHGGELFQIFTRSEHPRHTLFYEIIERMGAESFGTANIKALYEAVQRDLDHQ